MKTIDELLKCLYTIASLLDVEPLKIKGLHYKNKKKKISEFIRNITDAVEKKQMDSYSAGYYQGGRDESGIDDDSVEGKNGTGI